MSFDYNVIFEHIFAAESLLNNNKSYEPSSPSDCFVCHKFKKQTRLKKHSPDFIEITFIHKKIHTNYKKLYFLYHYPFFDLKRKKCKDYKKAKMFYLEIREDAFRLHHLFTKNNL